MTSTNLGTWFCNLNCSTSLRDTLEHSSDWLTLSLSSTGSDGMLEDDDAAEFVVSAISSAITVCRKLPRRLSSILFSGSPCKDLTLACTYMLLPRFRPWQLCCLLPLCVPPFVLWVGFLGCGCGCGCGCECAPCAALWVLLSARNLGPASNFRPRHCFNFQVAKLSLRFVKIFTRRWSRRKGKVCDCWRFAPWQSCLLWVSSGLVRPTCIAVLPLYGYEGR